MSPGSFVTAALLIVLFGAVTAEIDEKRADVLAGKVENTTLLMPEKNQQKWDSVAEEVKLNGGCDPNVCFALDGSVSIPPDEYELQKNFVQLIAAIVGADPRAMFAAGQYGLEVEVIQRLTTNAKGFLKQVTQSQFFKSAQTFIEPGILYCSFELGKVQGEPAKLVLLGDGRSNFVDRARAVAAVQQFKSKSPANEVCAVGVGFKDPGLLEEIVGRADRVLEVNQWPTVLNILDDLVEEICGPLRPRPPTTRPPTTLAPVTQPPTTQSGNNPCPCDCIIATDFGDVAERRARKAARRQCKSFKGTCKVQLCPGVPPSAFKCC